MRITLTIEGGVAHFPGLARPRVVDTEGMPAAEAQELEQLVERAHASSQEQAADAKRGADRRSYEIVFEQGDQKRVLRAEDPLPAALSALVARLRSAAPLRGSSGS